MSQLLTWVVLKSVASAQATDHTTKLGSHGLGSPV
jgi:hypothetical protein